jgi:hypothetical protein
MTDAEILAAAQALVAAKGKLDAATAKFNSAATALADRQTDFAAQGAAVAAAQSDYAEALRALRDLEE